MEGPGIDDIQPVPVPPAPATWEPGNLFPSPRAAQGRCEPNTGDWCLNRHHSLIWASQLWELLQRLLATTSPVFPVSGPRRSYLQLTICHSRWSHHFHTSLSDAGPEQSAHIWYNCGYRHWEMSAVGADIVMTLGLGPGDAGVSAMSPAVTVTISKSDPISGVTRYCNLSLTDNSWEPLIFQHSKLYFLIWFWIPTAHKLNIILVHPLNVTMDSVVDPHGCWY